MTPPVTFTISASVSGLSGTLVLQDNGGDNLSITSNGTFSFATKIPNGQTYSVTVLTQPTGQTCSLGLNSNGAATANITVNVTCSSTTLYTISAAVSGLSGTLVLQDNGGDNLTITSNATFPFVTQIASGGTYAVTILTEPVGQTCTLGSNSSGTATANVTVNVTCSTTLYTISAAVSGLSGTLVLQDNGGNNLTITSNGTFPFTTTIASGGSYAVTVLTQPSGETCTLGSNSSGTATANITVNVTCSAITYTISAAVTGLTSGTLVLQDNGGDNLSITSNGTFPFATKIASGGSYAVTVLTQPSGETCTLGSNSSGTATANVTVNVTCSAILYTISAAVSGLSGTVVLQDNGGNNLSITSNGTFPFTTKIASGGSYAVTVLTQPSGETCSLGSNSSGTATANVTVNVVCSAITYTISAAVTGLTSGTLVLQDNGGDNLSITSNGTFPFATKIASSGSYVVTILTQPSGQTCTLGSNSSGTATSNVTVNVTCTATLYTISVAVTGLTGTLVVQDSKSDALTFTTNNTQTFATSYASGLSYTVTVQTQPSGQTCTLGSNATGTITSNITVNATCTASASLSSISPTSIGAGTPSLLLTANGAGFTSGSQIAFKGTALTATTFVSSSKLTAVVPFGDIGTAGSAAITVSGATGSQTLTIAAAVTPAVENVTISGLSLPVRLAFAPDGALMIAEQQVLVSSTLYGYILRAPISGGSGTASTWATFIVGGNSVQGLLGMAVDPADPPTASGGSVFVFYISTGGDSRIAKVSFGGGVVDLVTGLPVAQSGDQIWLNGGKLAVHTDPTSGNTYIFASTGGSDLDPDWSQISSTSTSGYLHGKILRYNTDGSIPSDNPFGSSDPIYACGFRNSFGFDFHPSSGALYATDNGNQPSSGQNFPWWDALDRVAAGDAEGFGFGYKSTSCESSSTSPLWGGTGSSESPSDIATTGTMFYTGSVFPQLQNTVLVTGDNVSNVYDYAVNEYGSPAGTLLSGSPSTVLSGLSVFGLTDIAQGPDGCIYITAEGSNQIVRLKPATGTSPCK